MLNMPKLFLRKRIRKVSKLNIGDLIVLKSNTENIGTVVDIRITTFSKEPKASVAWYSGSLKGSISAHFVNDLEKING